MIDLGRAALLVFLASACGGLGSAVVATEPLSWPPIDVPLDWDGDGDPDFARVRDWDGDGTLEMTDIQAAIDALTDAGAKTVWIEPGSFAPPPSGGDILRLPSNLLLSGWGSGVTVLRGYPGSDRVSRGAVIVNDAPDSGNENITIANLAVDGGWRGGDATGFAHARAGILFSRCTSCVVERVTVHDTLHTCLYSKNGRDVQFRHNTMRRCGTYLGQGIRYPCVYLYASSGLTQEDVHVTNNSCIGAGHSGLNTRHDGSSLLRDVHFTDNVIRNTRIDDGEAAGCIVISGVTGGSYSNNVCINTGSLSVLSSTDVVVDGLDLLSVVGTHGVQLLGSKNLVLNRLRIEGAGASGIALFHDVEGRPRDHENLTISDSTVRRVKGYGVYAVEGLVLDNVRVERSTFDGIDLGGLSFADSASPSQGVVLHGNLVRDFGKAAPGAAWAAGIVVTGSMEGLDVRDNTLEDIGDPSSYGIVHDVWPVASDSSYLCRNDFLGAFDTQDMYDVAGRPDFQSDADLDRSPDACDCRNADARTHPHAIEVNDAQDNQCPEDLDYGIVDEISGTPGFDDPDRRDEYSWAAQPGANLYEVARSSMPTFAPCETLRTAQTWSDDWSDPAPGVAHYYLVRPYSPQPGSWGQTSARVKRALHCIGD